ncbi:MAG TPA: anti-sigma factor [Pyrinomonadaceae bacterium]|nr:anti-sigma factor [Pyrinomonadaceae bacterium]
MAHEDYKAMIPAHALSALDAEEARAMNQHLSECAECRDELADWESTAAALALHAEPVEPSPQVRDRIMSAIRTADAPEKVVQFAERRSLWTSFGSLGAIAAVVLFAALIVSIVVLWQQNRALKDQMARSNEFVKLLTAPGSRMAELAGTVQASGATAKIAYDKTGHAMLMAKGLPPAPQGKEYQLWYIVGTKPPMPGKSFAPDATGQGTLTDQMPHEAMDSAVFAVTLEPTGGLPAPTGEIYLRSGL